MNAKNAELRDTPANPPQLQNYTGMVTIAISTFPKTQENFLKMFIDPQLQWIPLLIYEREYVSV